MWDILYRPRKYSDVLGQDGSVRLLKTRIGNGTAFDTSYIFAGGYGRGKTTLSRIHAMAMLCQDLDSKDPEPCGACDSCTNILAGQSQAFTERDAASNGSAEAMRALVEELPYVLEEAPKRIYLIDEAQRLSNVAQDILLKPIEEKQLVVMGCTTEAEKIRGAIRSRCEEYTIRKVSREDILPRMKSILREQGVEHQDDAVLIVIDHANGHVRNVLNNLEMVAQLGPVTVDAVRDYLHLSAVTLYYQILLNLDAPAEALRYLDKACETVGPAEVAVGLAEAAMNCYRMARRCHVDFSYVDRGLAEGVYSKYQDGVVSLARWFSACRDATRLTLELRILSLLNGQVPAVEAYAGVSPLTIVAAAPVEVARPQPPPASPALAPPPTKSTDPKPAAPTAGVPLTSEDETELEALASGGPLPRMRGSEQKEMARKRAFKAPEPWPNRGEWYGSFKNHKKSE